MRPDRARANAPMPGSDASDAGHTQVSARRQCDRVLCLPAGFGGNRPAAWAAWPELAGVAFRQRPAVAPLVRVATALVGTRHSNASSLPVTGDSGSHSSAVMPSAVQTGSRGARTARLTQSRALPLSPDCRPPRSPPSAGTRPARGWRIGVAGQRLPGPHPVEGIDRGPRQHQRAGLVRRAAVSISSRTRFSRSTAEAPGTANWRTASPMSGCEVARHTRRNRLIARRDFAAVGIDARRDQRRRHEIRHQLQGAESACSSAALRVAALGELRPRRLDHREAAALAGLFLARSPPARRPPSGAASSQRAVPGQVVEHRLARPRRLRRDVEGLLREGQRRVYAGPAGGPGRRGPTSAASAVLRLEISAR
jgi:hypothetical protein